MKCKDCIYRTTVETTKWHTRYSTIHERDINIKEEVMKPACAFNVGMPVEIPEDRLPCKEFKSEQTSS